LKINLAVHRYLKLELDILALAIMIHEAWSAKYYLIAKATPVLSLILFCNGALFETAKWSSYFDPGRHRLFEMDSSFLNMYATQMANFCCYSNCRFYSFNLLARQLKRLHNNRLGTFFDSCDSSNNCSIIARNALSIRSSSILCERVEHGGGR
jgi:hypothetical protein